MSWKRKTILTDSFDYVNEKNIKTTLKKVENQVCSTYMFKVTIETIKKHVQN